MQKIQTEKVTWIDFYKPNQKDIDFLKKNFSLHPLVIEEFSMPTMRPKAAEYDTCLYLAIHVPLFNEEDRTTYPGEIDIVLTKDTLITSRDTKIIELENFFKDLEKDERKRELYMNESPASLLRLLVENVFESCFPKLDHISEKLDYIEKEIFVGNEKEMVFEISLVKRDILNFRRTMKPQKSVIESLAQREYKFIDPNLKPYFQDLVGTNIRVWNNLESAKETIESLEDTNNSLLSNKLDMTMKVLTIFSAILLPLTVYSNIMSMSTTIPMASHSYGFWLHVATMVVIALITFTIFRIKKWL
jgi:magnesium transporter